MVEGYKYNIHIGAKNNRIDYRYTGILHVELQ